MEHVNRRKFTGKKEGEKEKKVEEIQLADLASPGNFALKNGEGTNIIKLSSQYFSPGHNLSDFHAEEDAAVNKIFPLTWN